MNVQRSSVHHPLPYKGRGALNVQAERSTIERSEPLPTIAASALAGVLGQDVARLPRETAVTIRIDGSIRIAAILDLEPGPDDPPTARHPLPLKRLSRAAVVALTQPTVITAAGWPVGVIRPLTASEAMLEAEPPTIEPKPRQPSTAAAARALVAAADTILRGLEASESGRHRRERNRHMHAQRRLRLARARLGRLEYQLRQAIEETTR